MFGMIQTATRAPLGQRSGGRSTMAEYGKRPCSLGGTGEWNMFGSFSFVMRGLDPRIHPKPVDWTMDCRVGDRPGDRKPGNDDGALLRRLVVPDRAQIAQRLVERDHVGILG